MSRKFESDIPQIVKGMAYLFARIFSGLKNVNPKNNRENQYKNSLVMNERQINRKSSNFRTLNQD